MYDLVGRFSITGEYAFECLIAVVLLYVIFFFSLKKWKRYMNWIVKDSYEKFKRQGHIFYTFIVTMS